MENKLLCGINSPEDLKKLNTDEINTLCDEIRDVIISTVSKNGGHLASNLGSVELTVAIHRAFNSPQDAIVFDVGHQSYTHKLLTGRFNSFSSLRQKDGISGFMRPGESEHDPFVTGHSGNSVSAAFGIYKAKALNNEPGTAVAVIGDGSMTSGMAYEALNNAAAIRSRFIVILNDNKMSISRNVGAMARAFAKMRTKPKYHYIKFAISDFLKKIPLIGKPIEHFIFKVKEGFKSMVYRKNIFTDLGFNYLGPVDGHNVEAMESLFKIAERYTRPTLVHVITTKGKGYKFAEENPNDYHGVSPFDIKDGANAVSGETFSSVAGNTLCEMAKFDDKICAVTAAMREGTGLYDFSKLYKNRFFDVGIAEQHALTFCAGLASKGIKPYFAVYSSFLQRSYDQIVHDTAIAGLPVRILVDRAGIVGEDGETHQGIFDVSFLSSVPGIKIYSPCCFKELSNTIKRTSEIDCPVAIRYPRGASVMEFDDDFNDDFTVFGKSGKKCVVSYGRIFCNAYKALENNVTFDLIKLNRIYPIEKDLINLLLKYDEILFFEESVKSGSISEKLGDMLLEKGFSGVYKAYTLPNSFIPAMKVSDALGIYGLDENSIKKAVSNE